MRWRLAALAALTTLASAPADKPAIDGYTDYAALVTRVQAADAHDLASSRSLAKTAGDRDVFLITIGTEDVARKPAILMVGNVEADRLIGSELAMGMVENLLASAGEEKTKALLERVTLYVIPRPSPDSSERFFQPPYRATDGNARRTDDDRDFEIGEDPAEDLDGDGWITSMRVADPAGPYRLHPDDPRVLIKADASKNEQGAYRLYVEGTDNDKDQAWNEDAALGVSFNQNFPAKYDFFGKGSGPHQVSEPETRAVADFCFDHPNIAAVFVFGTQDNLFHPAKPDGEEKIKTKVQANDAPLLKRLAEDYQKIHGGKDAPSSPAGAGSFSDWSYLQFGRWAFVARAWWPTIDPPKEEKKSDGEKEEKDKDERGKDDLRFLKWMDSKSVPGFTPWNAFEHPDFPGQVVEVGGIRPFVESNPPASEFPGLIAKHVEFLRLLVDRLPSLAVADVRPQAVGESIAKLSLKVINKGLLPTMSQMGQIAEVPYPLVWELKLEGKARLLSGHPRGSISPVGSFASSDEISWLVAVPDDASKIVTFTVRSPSVGEVVQPIELPRTP